MRVIFSLLLLFLFYSCSFNNVFLHPAKLDVSKQPLKVVYNKNFDTLVVADTSCQPYFIVSDGGTLKLSYSIQSSFIKSKSGNNLNVWCITPNENYNNRNIIFFHGNAGSIVSQHKMMLPFVNQGYKVYAVDYSGFGFSTGKATRKNVLMDGNSSVEYLTSLDSGKTQQWIIYGQSLGGHLTPVVGLQNERWINGLILEGAFSSHKDIGANTAGILARALIAEQYSAKKALKKFKKPTLIIHSKEDGIVPFAHGQRLFETANEPKLFLQIDQCHICGPIYYSESISKKIELLFSQ